MKLMHSLVGWLVLDAHCSLDPSKPLCVHFSRALGRPPWSAILPHGMGGTHKRVGQHHGLLDSSARENCLWS